MLISLPTISTETRFVNPYWEYRFDSYQLRNGALGEYHYVHSRGATIIIPQMKDGTFILVRQFRYLLQRESLEFPCGGINPRFEPIENAYHELLEETGYAAKKLDLISTFAPCNGICDEMCYVYYSKELIEQQASPEDSEEFEILYLTKHQINQTIQKGELWDGMTLAAWTLYLSKELP